MDTRQKIVSREGLEEILSEHRRAGRKIVFANGVFDLLHVGHVRYLKAARAEGDILIVAGVGLGRRGEDRVGKLLGLRQALGQ